MAASKVKFEDLLSTGAHFGHVTRKWNPNYQPFILMEKNGVHIINLDETIRHLDIALSFIIDKAKKNGEFLFVGTKSQAKDIVQQEADRCSMFYVVERWLGGTLTNFTTIKKSIKRLLILEKESSEIYTNLTKKELSMLERERIKLADLHRGIKDMKHLPKALFFVDGIHEKIAISEAINLGIPTFGIVDSNTDPRNIDFPIPANDDSMKTIGLIVNYIADTIIEATGGTAQMDEAVDTAQVSETSEKITEESPAEEPDQAEEEEEKEEVQEENQE